MPCDCAQCRQHWATLGLEGQPVTRLTLRRAYRAAALRSHPDRFENEPALRHQAEEQFKRLQVAYRELTEHLPPDGEFAEADADLATPAVPFIDVAPVAPALSFGDAPGCYVAPDLPPIVARIAKECLGPGVYPVAIVDLARNNSFSSFFLLATHSAIVKDGLGITSLVWYEDLGNVEMLARFPGNTRGLLRRIREMISPPGRRCVLNVYRRDSSRFCSLTNEVDDSVKAVLYRYLLRKKSQTDR
jgi:hypothetical protein